MLKHEVRYFISLFYIMIIINFTLRIPKKKSAIKIKHDSLIKFVDFKQIASEIYKDITEGKKTVRAFKSFDIFDLAPF